MSGHRPFLVGASGLHVRLRAIQSDECAVARLYEKLRIHQRTEQRVAHFPIEAPQTLGLRGRQAETWHFYELTLNALKDIFTSHGSSPICAQ